MKLDVRVIAATNCNLVDKVNQGKFRADLFYRLNLGHIVLPPLRSQKEAIIPLAQMFLARYSGKLKRRFRFISREAMKFLYEYDWHGNVRELNNVIERIVLLHDEYEMRSEFLAFLLAGEGGSMYPAGNAIDLNSIILPEDGLPNRLINPAQVKSRFPPALLFAEKTFCEIPTSVKTWMKVNTFFWISRTMAAGCQRRW